VTEEAARLESNRSHDAGARQALRSIRAAKVQRGTRSVFTFESAGGSGGQQRRRQEEEGGGAKRGDGLAAGLWRGGDGWGKATGRGK
jgi:hypothetical protein